MTNITLTNIWVNESSFESVCSGLIIKTMNRIWNKLCQNSERTKKSEQHCTSMAFASELWIRTIDVQKNPKNWSYIAYFERILKKPGHLRKALSLERRRKLTTRRIVSWRASASQMGSKLQDIEEDIKSWGV